MATLRCVQGALLLSLLGLFLHRAAAQVTSPLVPDNLSSGRGRYGVGAVFLDVTWSSAGGGLCSVSIPGSVTLPGAFATGGNGAECESVEGDCGFLVGTQLCVITICREPSEQASLSCYDPAPTPPRRLLGPLPLQGAGG